MPPAKKEPSEERVHTNRGKLQMREVDYVSRLILFNKMLRHWGQELLGPEYDIAPEVIKDISAMGGGRVLQHECQLSQHMTGLSPKHLAFNQNWLGKIFVREGHGQGGLKNIGRTHCLLAGSVAAWLTRAQSS